jgi:hypothetical protein
MERRTARNFLNAYEFARSKSANISDLAIDISSVYLLAALSTPEEARDEVLISDYDADAAVEREAYDSEKVRQQIRDEGALPVISNRCRPCLGPI